jgi:hypothetical protein
MQTQKQALPPRLEMMMVMRTTLVPLFRQTCSKTGSVSRTQNKVLQPWPARSFRLTWLIRLLRFAARVCQPSVPRFHQEELWARVDHRTEQQKMARTTATGKSGRCRRR